MCGWSGKMPCVCQEEGSGKTSNRKRNRKKEKEEMKREKTKQSKKTKTKNKHECWKHKLKSNTPRWTCPSWRNGSAVVSAWWNRSFFQRRCSRVASRETACQGNSIPRETGEWKTVLNYMGVGAIYRWKKGCDHRPRTVLNTSES